MPDARGVGNRTQNGVIAAAGSIATRTDVIDDLDATYLVVVLNVSAVSGGGSVTVAINGVTASGYVYPLLVPAAVLATGVTPYRVGVGLTPSPQAVANDVVPRKIQVVSTVSGTVTFGVDYEAGA